MTQRFMKCANAETAAGSKKYLRNQFDFFGLTATKRRDIQKVFFASMKDLNIQPTQEEIKKAIEVMWEQPQREYQYFAMEFGEKFLDFNDNDGVLDSAEMMLTSKSWWDTVDFISTKIVGKAVFANREVLVKRMQIWIEAESFWLRRSAILHQLNYKEHTDEKLLFDFCLKQAHEGEFFIRKAIGWALRQHARLYPKNIRKFVQENKDKLSTLSFQQAMKHL